MAGGASQAAWHPAVWARVPAIYRQYIGKPAAQHRGDMEPVERCPTAGEKPSVPKEAGESPGINQGWGRKLNVP